jgi:hypothetical protein
MRIYLLFALLFAGAFSSLSAQRQRRVWWGDLQRHNEPPPGGVIRIYFDKWCNLILTVNYMHSWGLENKANFPNLPAEHDLLNHRLNFGSDDVPTLSAL